MACVAAAIPACPALRTSAFGRRAVVARLPLRQQVGSHLWLTFWPDGCSVATSAPPVGALGDPMCWFGHQKRCRARCRRGGRCAVPVCPKCSRCAVSSRFCSRAGSCRTHRPRCRDWGWAAAQEGGWSPHGAAHAFHAWSLVGWGYRARLRRSSAPRSAPPHARTARRPGMPGPRDISPLFGRHMAIFIPLHGQASPATLLGVSLRRAGTR